LVFHLSIRERFLDLYVILTSILSRLDVQAELVAQGEGLREIARELGLAAQGPQMQ
jgi:hypothetical protein